MEAPPLPGSQLRTVFEYDSTEAECVAALEFNQGRLNRRLQRTAVAQACSALILVVWIGFIFLALYLVIERRDGPGRCSSRWASTTPDRSSVLTGKSGNSARTAIC
jgi:hypothetical protein